MTLEEQLRDFETEEQLQDALVRHMCSLIAGADLAGLNTALRDAATWSQKVDACVRTLLGHMPHTVQYAGALIEAALARISGARDYVVPARSLRSQLVLLHAKTAYAAAAPLTLQQHSQRPIVVHQLRSPLSYVSKDMECSSVINRYLDADILSAFEKKNLCEFYKIHKEE